MADIKEKLKSRGFWACVLSALAGFIGGDLCAADFIVNLIKAIGG